MSKKKDRKDKKTLSRMISEEKKAHKKKHKAPSSGVDPVNSNYKPDKNASSSAKQALSSIDNTSKVVSETLKQLQEKKILSPEVNINVSEPSPGVAKIVNDAMAANSKGSDTGGATKAQATVEADEPREVPARPSLTMRGINKIMTGVDRLKESIVGSRAATEVEKDIRKQYLKLVQQSIITQEIIKDNQVLLQDRSKADKNLASVLTEVNNNHELKDIFARLEKGQQLYGRELIQATEFMQRITGTLDKAGLSLQVNLPKVMDSMSKFVQNTELDVASRRDAFGDIQKAIKGLKIESDTAKEVMAIDSKRLNFTETENAKISEVLGKLSEEMEKGDVANSKLTGTMRELNGTLGSVVLTNKELDGFLEKQVEGQSMKDRLKGGLGAMGGGLKRGILSSLLAAAGLPGADLIGEDAMDLFGGMGGLFKGGKGAGTIAKTGGGLLSKIPLLGGLLGGGEAAAGAGSALAGGAAAAGEAGLGIASKIPGIGLLIAGLAALGAAVYGAVKGITNTLDEWKNFFKGFWDAGVSFVKLVGRAANVFGELVSGFMEGHPIIKSVWDAIKGFAEFIIDLPVMLVKKIAEGFENIFGWMGIGAGKAGGMLGGVSKWFDSLLPDKGAASTASTVDPKKASSLSQSITAGAMAMTAAASPAMGNSDGFTAPPPGIQQAKLEPLPAMVDTRGFSAASKQEQETRAAQRTTSENSGKDKTIVVQTQAAPPPRSPQRTTQIDDIHLAVINSNLMDR